jgi:hypothetical protein
MPSTVCAAAALAAVKRPPAVAAANMFRREIDSMTSSPWDIFSLARRLKVRCHQA